MRYSEHAEKTIEDLAKNPRLENVKTNISQIPEISCESFATIQSEGTIRSCHIMDSTVLQLLGTRTTVSVVSILSVCIFALPVLGILMSFFVKWWLFVVGILLGIASFKAGRVLYYNTLFSAARSSEVIFSFLFSQGIIGLEFPGEDTILPNRIYE